MALTRSFKELVQRHVAEDPAYAEALLREGINPGDWLAEARQESRRLLIEAGLSEEDIDRCCAVISWSRALQLRDTKIDIDRYVVREDSLAVLTKDIKL